MKNINKIIISVLLGALYFTSVVFSSPWSGSNGDHHYYQYNPSAITIQQVLLDGNNIASFFYNTGIFNQDLRTSNHPGFMWPKGSGKEACFTAGLSMGCYIGGQLREAMNSYKGELAPGYVEIVNGSPVAKTDGRFRVYRVKSTDNESNPDYAQWGDMIPYGAPYIDINNNGHWDPGVDKPGKRDASITLFACLTDGFPAEHKLGEGFGGGTLPMFAEYHFTAWCYDTPGLGDLQFINWVVINKNIAAWERLYIGVTVDPDLGWADDDYIGCDTAKNMGFCYNGDNDDNLNQAVWAYGANPPAFGMDYFTSPVNRITGDTLGLTSFVYFTNNSTAGPLCEKDPNGEALPAYYLLKGVKKDQTPWVIPGTNPPQITKFCYTGDPETHAGWNEGNPPGDITGSVLNCGGPNVLTGTVVPVNPVGDRRFIFNSGAEDFKMNPNDTQNIILAQFVARGSSNLNSVTALKRVDAVAQKIFDLNFKVIPAPPPPIVTQSFREVNNNSNVEITLSWTDTSEFFNYQDTIFTTPQDSSYYRFEGYMVFELRPSANQVPDITDPVANLGDLKLLAIYDKEDTVGFLLDTFKVGIGPHGEDINALLNVVPPNNFSAPGSFPNGGLRRYITINTTNFPEEHGGNTSLIYGHTYKYIVIAYAYNTNQRFKGMAIDRNSLDSRLMTIVPQHTLAGSEFTYKNGDTLNTSRRDLGVMPIVRAQELLKEAKYRILFNNPDTTYSILRSFNGGANFDVLKSNLKFANHPGDTIHGGANNTIPDDSSRVIDGILFKVAKIRYNVLTPAGNFSGNVGVIKDPTLSRDSIQTRYYGWDYFPTENNPYDSSQYRPFTSEWQSKSISISYPNRSNYIKQRSLLNPEDLRKIKIVFTGYGSGQQAYRYLAVSVANYQYQDMREVPIKVYEISSDDGTPAERQVNCGFLEFPGGAQNNKWEPTDSTDGGREILYIFGSDYSETPSPPYIDHNLFLQQPFVDVMYVWGPRLKTAGSSFRINDRFIIYPYSVTKPEIVPGIPLYYDIDTKAPAIGSIELANQGKDLENVRVVPNPYYGGSSLENSVTGRFVTFTRLPKECTIKIYSLNGDLIQVLSKNNTNSTLEWNLTNSENVPVASGMYIALVNAPGIGYKVLKMAIFTPEERIDF